MGYERRILASLAASAIVLAETAFADSNIENRSYNAEFDEGMQFDDSRNLQETRVNIFQKLKESLAMSIIGILLICITPCLIWKNEDANVRQLKRIDFVEKKTVAVQSDSAGEENSGQLVHFVGDVNVGEAPLQFNSDTLNLTGPIPRAVALKRTCYIYQKFELAENSVEKDRIGGGETRTTNYSMKEDWTQFGPQPERLENVNETNSRGIWDQLIAASTGSSPVTEKKFPPMLTPEMIEQMGLNDPNEAPHELSVSKAAHVGEFGLSNEIIVENRPVFLSELSPVPVDFLPESVEGCEGLTRGSDNILRTFPEGEEPKNGDCKVVYEYVVDGFKCSFVVQQTGKVDPESGAKFGVEKGDIKDDTCFGVCGDDLGELWMVRRGIHSLEDMVNTAQEEQKMAVKIVRLVAWVLLCAGWIMLFSPFTTALEVLPILSKLGYFAVVILALIVSITCCCTVTMLAWIRFRPFLATGILALSLGIWGIVIWRLDYAAEEGGDEA